MSTKKHDFCGKGLYDSYICTRISSMGYTISYFASMKRHFSVQTSKKSSWFRVSLALDTRPHMDNNVKLDCGHRCYKVTQNKTKDNI